MTMNLTKKYLTVEEAASYLHVCRRTIYNYVKGNILSKHKLGARIYLSLIEIEELLSRSAEGGMNE